MAVAVADDDDESAKAGNEGGERRKSVDWVGGAALTSPPVDRATTST